MGDLPYVSSEQGGGLIIHHGLIIRTIRYKEKPQMSTRLKLQGSRKIGCHAHNIVVKKCTVYPEYRVTEVE